MRMPVVVQTERTWRRFDNLMTPGNRRLEKVHTIRDDAIMSLLRACHAHVSRVGHDSIARLYSFLNHNRLLNVVDDESNCKTLACYSTMAMGYRFGRCRWRRRDGRLWHLSCAIWGVLPFMQDARRGLPFEWINSTPPSLISDFYTVWGECTHVFHMHCLLKWIGTAASKHQCPMDRRPWGSSIIRIYFTGLELIITVKLLLSGK